MRNFLFLGIFTALLVLGFYIGVELELTKAFNLVYAFGVLLSSFTIAWLLVGGVDE